MHERVLEPSDASPFRCRERAYLVDGQQSDLELEEQLEAELASLQRELGQTDTPQLVQLALFDKAFEQAPSSAPIASLSWNTRGEPPEIWVRGARRSSAPRNEAPEPLGDGADAEEPEPIPLVTRQTRPSLAPVSQETPSSVATEPEPPDSGQDWQSPHRSGEYLIPPLDEASDEPPSSQRVVASEELISTLFERMHELHYLPSIAAGASYVIEMIEEHIPCDAALLHVFDVDAREFVVARGLGPGSRELVLTRTAAASSRLEEALRRQVTLDFDVAATGSEGTLWPRLGVAVARALCAPVHQNGRYLGAIELGRVAGRPEFSQGQRSALDYVCDQLAEFIADRPLDLTSTSLRPAPPESD